MFLIVLQMGMHATKFISPKPNYGKQTYIKENKPSALLVTRGKLFCFLIIVFTM